jgi:DNA-binding beta-propeller fold protein YncE
MRPMAVATVTAVLSLLPIIAMAQTRAVAIDSEGHQIVYLDLAKSTVDSKISVPLPEVSRGLLSPDNRTILAIYDGGLRVTINPVELHPKARASYAIVTPDKVIGSGDLGWGTAGQAFSSDGRYAYVLIMGDDAKNDADLKPSGLVRIDAATGAEAGRLMFNRSAGSLRLVASGATAIVFSKLQWKRNPQIPARLLFVDTATWKESGSLEIPGNPVAPSAAGELLYLVDPGEKNAPGKVFVVDPAKRSLVKSINVGPGSTAAGSDRDGNFFVLSQGPDGKAGKVTILRDGDVAATYGTGAAPLMVTLSAAGTRLYVSGKQLSIVNLVTRSSSPGLDVAYPLAVLPTTDGRRVITVAAEGKSCCRINVFDTAANKELTSFLGGSKAKRVGQNLAAIALSMATYQNGLYSIYTPKQHGAARGPVAFGPAEKKAYAVDTQTDDVTVVDMETGQRTVNIAAGSGLKEVIALPDAGLIAAVSDERIDLIDTASDVVRESIHMKKGAKQTVATPDEKRIVFYGKQGIVVLDTATGKQVGMIDDLKNVTELIFLK